MINKINGVYKTQLPEYSVWCDMKKRCNNPKSNHYKDYGARGIKVCPSWERSFMEFYLDMGARPEGLTLDRIDCNGDYSPDNCRWSTRKVQSINQRIFISNKTGHAGLSFHSRDKKWVAYINVNGKFKSLGYFVNKSDALKKRLEAEEIYYDPLLKLG